MRAARYLIAALGLLTLATSASAECAWVLWGQFASTQGTLMGVPLAGWPRWEDCEKERVAREAKAQSPKPGLLVCLPDTLDPRGPKGK
jgi:hypothetical protein